MKNLKTIKKGDILYSTHDFEKTKGCAVEVTFIRWITDEDGSTAGKDMLVEYKGEEMWITSPYWITRERPIHNQDIVSEFLQMISSEEVTSVSVNKRVENKVKKGNLVTVELGNESAQYFIGVNQITNKVIVELEGN